MPNRPPSTAPVIPGFSYLRPLGTGGFADVFLYEQDLPRRTVAVKVLLADAIDPDVRRRFAQEADLMARLSSHSAMLTVFQASIAADGRPYLVTEYCPDSMSQLIRRQPMSVAQLLDTGVRLASALETAHRQGVLHRDIKPSNILITSLGMPVLADFGIATMLSRGSDSSHTEDLVGMSVPWSSPEILDELTGGTVASEIWSLGATLHTLLVGRSPFSAAPSETSDQNAMIQRIRRARPNPIERDDAPRVLKDVLAGTMRHDPVQRPASMFEFAEQLRRVQTQLGLPPTQLEIGAEFPSLGSPGWKTTEPATALSGPALSTVQQDSRRAARAAKRQDAAPPTATTVGERQQSGRAERRNRIWALIAVIAGSLLVLVTGAVLLIRFGSF